MRGFLVDELTVIRGGTRLLDGVSAALPAVGCSGVVGPSGSGKSTLLRVLNRLEEPTTGRVLLDGRPVTELDVLALRRRVGLVGQRPVLLADRVEQELRIGRPELSTRKGAELLERVGLPAGFGQRACAELSGGEAQRVCLARALAVEPQVLLLDEPTSALDGFNVSLIGELTRQHVASGGGVVLVSHDVGLVRSMADQVLVLDQGRLIAAGHPGQIDYLRTGS